MQIRDQPHKLLAYCITFVLLCLTTPTDRTHRIPVVAELPLTMQAYQVVDDCGPAGITNPVSLVKSNTYFISKHQCQIIFFNVRVIYFYFSHMELLRNIIIEMLARINFYTLRIVRK